MVFPRHSNMAKVVSPEVCSLAHGTCTAKMFICQNNEKPTLMNLEINGPIYTGRFQNYYCSHFGKQTTRSVARLFPKAGAQYDQLQYQTYVPNFPGTMVQEGVTYARSPSLV